MERKQFTHRGPRRSWRATRYALAALLLACVGSLVLGFSPARAAAPGDLTAGTYDDGQGHALPYRLFVPPGYSAAASYPLVLFLHGAGEAGTDNTKQVMYNFPDQLIQADQQARQPAFVLAPQAPYGAWWSGGDWSLQAAVALIGQLQQRYPGIDSNRVYVMGLSMGGYGSWSALATWPGKFAAAVPIAGGGDRWNVQGMVNTPIWAFHSADDGTIGVERSREMIAAIRAAGGNPRYTEYCTNGALPCYGHWSWVGAYADPNLLPWLFAQRRSSTPPTATPMPTATPTPPVSGILPNGTYKLTVKHSGKVLDVAGVSTANGAAVQQWDWWGGNNQRWQFERLADGTYKITSVNSGKVLDVSGVSQSNGAAIIQWDWLDGSNQHWRVEPLGNGYYRLIAKHSGKALGVNTASATNGEWASQWDWQSGDNQQWQISLP